MCTRLHTLSLQHTPLTKVPSYREVVSYLLQSLYILDDIPVNNRPVMSNRVMEEARHLLQELVYEVDEERRFESTILEQSIEAESVGIGK